MFSATHRRVVERIFTRLNKLRFSVRYNKYFGKKIIIKINKLDVKRHCLKGFLITNPESEIKCPCNHPVNFNWSRQNNFF